MRNPFKLTLLGLVLMYLVSTMTGCFTERKVSQGGGTVGYNPKYSYERQAFVGEEDGTKLYDRSTFVVSTWKELENLEKIAFEKINYTTPTTPTKYKAVINNYFNNTKTVVEDSAKVDSMWAYHESFIDSLEQVKKAEELEKDRIDSLVEENQSRHRK